MAYTDDTKSKVASIMQWAKANGIVEVTINAGELAKVLGLYDPPNDINNVKSVSDAMHDLCDKTKGDAIIYEPPAGSGTSVIIRYKVR